MVLWTIRGPRGLEAVSGPKGVGGSEGLRTVRNSFLCFCVLICVTMIYSWKAKRFYPCN